MICLGSGSESLGGEGEDSGSNESRNVAENKRDLSLSSTYHGFDLELRTLHLRRALPFSSPLWPKAGSKNVQSE